MTIRLITVRPLTVREHLADWIGGYVCLSCPLCSMSIRHRGTSGTEAERLAWDMARHVAAHRILTP